MRAIYKAVQAKESDCIVEQLEFSCVKEMVRFVVGEDADRKLDDKSIST